MTAPIRAQAMTLPQVHALLIRTLMDLYGLGRYSAEALGLILEPCLCGHCIGYRAKLGATIHLDAAGHVNVNLPNQSPAPAGANGVTPPANHGESSH